MVSCRAFIYHINIFESQQQFFYFLSGPKLHLHFHRFINYDLITRECKFKSDFGEYFMSWAIPAGIGAGRPLSIIKLL